MRACGCCRCTPPTVRWCARRWMRWAPRPAGPAEGAWPSRPACRDRLATAVRFMDAAPRPALLIMHGVTASGKSWLSERLVSAVHALRIRSDLERKRLRGHRAAGPADLRRRRGRLRRRTHAVDLRPAAGARRIRPWTETAVSSLTPRSWTAVTSRQVPGALALSRRCRVRDRVVRERCDDRWHRDCRPGLVTAWIHRRPPRQSSGSSFEPVSR